MFASANRSKWPLKIVIPLAVVLATLLALLMPNNARLENVLNTTFPSQLDPRIRLVAIDEDTLQHYGRLDNWSRDLHALALQTLQSADAEVVGMDILFSAPTNQDEALAHALTTNKVVLAVSPDLVRYDTPSTWNVPTGVSALNASILGVREYQTAYLATNGQKIPSLTAEMIQQTGIHIPLTDQAQLMRFIPQQQLQQATISYKQVIDDNVRYREIQNKIILIGLHAKGIGGTQYQDINGNQISGLYLQARALSSTLSPPFWRMPVWLTVLLSVTMILAVLFIRGLWGYALSLLPLTLAFVLWQANIIFPAVTISLAAILGSSLLALERWWILQHHENQDTLTGVGNRLAFTRAIEYRWPSHYERPLSLLLIELDEFQSIHEQHGHHAGDEVLRSLVQHIQKLKRSGDMVFRWGPGEFALLLDNTTPNELEQLIEHFRRELNEIPFKHKHLNTNVGGAATSQAIQTPDELVTAASRQRQRMKYQREQRA